jgi:hypothetical protein
LDISPMTLQNKLGEHLIWMKPLPCYHLQE